MGVQRILSKFRKIKFNKGNMKIIPSSVHHSELPFELNINFDSVFKHIEKQANNSNSPVQHSAQELLDKFANAPNFREGFTDLKKLEDLGEEIDYLLDFIFPEALQENEIKAISVPFNFTTFKFSKRFERILENAGENYSMKIRNIDESSLYVHACTFILAFYYDIKIDFRRPFFFDIPNIKTGLTHHYRVMFNSDFFSIEKTDTAPEITEEDIRMLIDNFDQENKIDLWKEKFPPNSYILKGFGIMNLFDVTVDEVISSMKEVLLSQGEDIHFKIEQKLGELFGLPNLQFGFSKFDLIEKKLEAPQYKKGKSFILSHEDHLHCENMMCEGFNKNLLNENNFLAVSDIERYGETTNYNPLYHTLKKKKIESFILAPIDIDDKYMGILELVSFNKYDLNSLNAIKLKDIIPVFTVAIQRAFKEHATQMESIIQENYTAIHPSVKWRFYDAVEKYVYQKSTKQDIQKLDDIIFKKVYPLYGQCDIKGSSAARNSAIQADLTHQLSEAKKVMNEALFHESLPIYSELAFRIETYVKEIKKGLRTGDEIGITEFFKKDVYPIFQHISEINPKLEKVVESYMLQIDENLEVVYDKRKNYEDSVTLLNEKMALYIDQEQEAAQLMFPHYFERFKTDGIEFNMYIGQSLVKNRTFEPLYLYNLRLWQLQLMCQLENIAFSLKKQMSYPLSIASLILVHSNDLAIKFRMDEKQFDVDGAYNIRYEILKKRIDKAFIKNTKERITQPGKMTIVYSQDKDAKEYSKYIQYLQSLNYLGENIENLELEDLQGISGLKALRVEILYNNNKKGMDIDEIMRLMKSEEQSLPKI